MRNILMTVMLLLVVALMFVNIFNGTGGLRNNIEAQGTKANTSIGALNP